MSKADRLPNLILGGPGRTGTTSLFEYLISHPSICGSWKKETNFFLSPIFGESLAPVETYTGLFSGCKRAEHEYAVEATPAYLLGGRRVASAMKELLKEFKIIFTLREPVERFISGYWHIKSKVLIDHTLNLERYLELSFPVDTASLSRYEELRYAILAEGRYADSLGEWYDMLGDSAIYIMFYDNLIEDQRQAINGLLGWLGLDSKVAMKGLPHTNKAMEFRSAPFQKIARTVARTGEPLLSRAPRAKKLLTRVYYGLNAKRSRDQCPHEVREFLEDYYKEPNKRLAALLRDKGITELPGWLENN
jgi:hypothetical protein